MPSDLKPTVRSRAGKFRRRSATLDTRRIAVVVGTIRSWQGRLTWEELCAEVERKTGDRYTRQALSNHLPIRAACESYRKKPRPTEDEKVLSATDQRIRNLQGQVRELETIRDALLEKFARWAYHAWTRGLDEAFLDQPLPKIDRSDPSS